MTPRTGIILIDSAIDGEWDIFRNAFSHLILPAAILGYLLARLYRAHDAQLHDRPAVRRNM